VSQGKGDEKGRGRDDGHRISQRMYGYPGDRGFGLLFMFMLGVEKPGIAVPVYVFLGGDNMSKRLVCLYWDGKKNVRVLLQALH
jgi:hypothetical protein